MVGGFKITVSALSVMIILGIGVLLTGRISKNVYEQLTGSIYQRITEMASSSMLSKSPPNKNDSSNVFQTHGYRYKVPNIIHFIWFTRNKTKNMSFVNYLSMRSANQVQKPDVIMLHCDWLPAGLWWDRLWREVPMKIMFRKPPTSIYGQKLGHLYHQADVAKIEILMEYGGIYLDSDVFVINSMNEFRFHDVTMGKEKPPKVIAGIIISTKDAPFLRMWHQSYRKYNRHHWDYNCAVVPYQLHLQHPGLLHVEPWKLTTPDWTERHLLWNQVTDWRHLPLIHTMYHGRKEKYNPENIKRLDTTFGQVTRYIYYGSPDIIDD